MEQPILAGIDVSARSLDTLVRRARRARRPAEFSNDAAGHKRLVRFLTRGNATVRVCLEATGVYHLDLALALHRHPRIQVMVANPAAVAGFARAQLQRSKTDAADAAVILEFLERMPFQPWKPPSPQALQLRALARRITALNQTRTREKNRLHAARACREWGDTVAQDIEVNIRHLTRRILRLHELALRIIRDNPELERASRRMLTIRGFGARSMIQVLAELAVLPQDMQPRQWAAHAGLDPRIYESGTSVRKLTRISRCGNRYLRAALFMPAMAATRWEPHVKAFSEKLVTRGKTKLQAIAAVMRKLLHAIHGMLRTDADFDGRKFYALGA